MSEPRPTPGLDQLGFYTLGGHVDNPRQMLTELAEAENLGLGQAFLSERLNVKEACALSGAAGAATESIGITTAATNHNTRHPAITAAFATTMHRLTAGRFTLGLGRGLRPQLAGLGLPPVTTAQLEAFAALMRRLWQGETIRDYDGPLGIFPKITLNEDFDEHIPLGITAFGPATLALAGRAFDVVVLHTFFSDDTVRRCVETVRTAAEQAGRDPATIKIWSCYATVTTDLDEETILLKTVGRMATYLQVYGDLLVRTNNWDTTDLHRFRTADVVRGLGRWADELRDIDTLKALEKAIPRSWLDCAAVGTAAECARKVRDQFDLGVDGVIMHGATPVELTPVVHSYRDQFAGPTTAAETA